MCLLSKINGLLVWVSFTVLTCSTWYVLHAGPLSAEVLRPDRGALPVGQSRAEVLVDVTPAGGRVTGLQTGSGHTGSSQMGHKSITVCNILLQVRTCCHILSYVVTFCYVLLHFAHIFL